MVEDRLVTCRIFTSRSKVMATTKQLKKGEMHSRHTLKVSTNVLQGETEGQHSRGTACQEVGTEDLGDTRSFCTGVVWIAEPPQVGWVSAHCSACSMKHYLLKYIFFQFFLSVVILCRTHGLTGNFCSKSLLQHLSELGEMLNWHGKKKKKQSFGSNLYPAVIASQTLISIPPTVMCASLCSDIEKKPICILSIQAILGWNF